MIGVVLGTGWRDQIKPSDLHGALTIERKHLYDGYTADETVDAIRKAHLDGVTQFVLTNACGTVNPDFRVGEVYAISDHLNLTGTCPNVGFQPLPDIYRVPDWLRPVVYAQVRGPAFETPAEANMLRILGADVVGMSTALEAMCAHSLGCEVVGLSLVTDIAGGADGHEEVLDVASQVDLAEVLDEVLEMA